MVHLESYCGILGQFLMPQLQQENVSSCFPVRWSAATLLEICVCLKNTFINNSGACIGPIAVPSYSPNLMPPDFIVWNSLRTVLIFSSPHVLLTQGKISSCFQQITGDVKNA